MSKNAKQVNSFKVGDRVRIVTGTKGKLTVTRLGTIVEVVAPKTYPNPAFVPMFRKGRQLASRNFESYVVEVDGGKGKDKFLWPWTSKLEAVTAPTPSATPAVPVPSPTIQASASITTLPDGTEIETREETLADGTTVKTTITRKKPVLLTDFTFVIDESGSMSPFRSRVIQAVSDKVQAISKECAATGLPQPNITIYTFEQGHVRCPVYRVAADKALSSFTYSPSGNTNLYDALGESLVKMIALADYKNPNHSFVIEVITDGEENSSIKFKDPSTAGPTKELLDLVTNAQNTGKVTVAFQCPRGGAAPMRRAFPMIPAGNIMEWEQTTAGFTYASNVSLTSSQNYSTQRSTGVRASSNYYVQPNLSSVSQSDLNKCTDLSFKYKVHNVTHEAEIQAFIEGKTGSPYIFGSAYFQLSKKEKVGGDKEVLIRDKATKRIYGGSEARKLIGLPELSLNQDAKIEPGNHANFDIFLESRSPNRKLVRGSLVLHDFTMTTSKAPTFDITVLTQNQTP